MTDIDHERHETGGTEWTPTRSFEVADGRLRAWEAGETRVSASPGWLRVDGDVGEGVAFARDAGLDEGVETLDTVLDVADDLPDERLVGVRARPRGDDGEVGSAFVDVDLPGVVAEATVRADGRVPRVEYRSDLDVDRLERAAGLDLGGWRDPVDASAARRDRLPDPPDALVDRAPEAGQRVATRATVHVHRSEPDGLGLPEEHLLVVGPFPERNDHRFERAETVTWARWPPGETTGFDVDETVDLDAVRPGDAAYEAGLAMRRAVEGTLDLTDVLRASVTGERERDAGVSHDL